jgi:hypothetical protein
MASRETTIVTRETVIIETTTIERIVYRGRGPGAGPPALVVIFFAFVLAYFAIYTLCLGALLYTVVGIVLLLFSLSLLVGTYLSLI